VLNLPVYLDNHATTRVDPRVVEAMLPFFTTHYGNAASVGHAFGWHAEEAVDTARAQVAALLGADPREVVFTSGATESNNLALKGALISLRERGNHVITAATEHRAVLDPLRRLAREGWSLTIIPPNAHGFIDPESIAAAINDRTVLVSVMAANNEVGTLNPVGAIGRLCRDRGVVFHTDATQAVGKVPLKVDDDGIDLLSLSAHKFYGPKGIGALFVRRRDRPVRVAPLFDGGGHERGLRSGTVAIPLVVGLGLAAELADRERPDEAPRLLSFRERLHSRILDRLDGVLLNGHPTLRLPGNLNLSFMDVDGEGLLMTLRDVAVSSGAACSSAEPEPSHVLRALGRSEDLSRSSLRFGLGRFTTAEEIDFAAAAVVDAVSRLRRLAGKGA
jgi:cysteine desulfurase